MWVYITKVVTQFIRSLGEGDHLVPSVARRVLWLDSFAALYWFHIKPCTWVKADVLEAECLRDIW